MITADVARERILCLVHSYADPQYATRLRQSFVEAVHNDHGDESPDIVALERLWAATIKKLLAEGEIVERHVQAPRGRRLQYAIPPPESP